MSSAKGMQARTHRENEQPGKMINTGREGRIYGVSL